jgi:hypothetical protein
MASRQSSETRGMVRDPPPGGEDFCKRQIVDCPFPKSLAKSDFKEGQAWR